MEIQTTNQENLVTTATKKCSICKQELPLSMYHRNLSRKDGLQAYCKECGKKYYENRRNKQSGGGIDSIVIDVVDGRKLTKVYTHPDLAHFQPRQLMAELKARGYRWDYMIEPQRKIMFDKI